VRTRRAPAAALAGLALLVAACGRKGNPLPPLRPAPAAPADVRVRRIDDRVEIRFTIPDANADATTPSVTDRVEIYAMPEPPGAAAPPASDLIAPAHLKGQIDVRHGDARPAKAGAPADTRPAPGDEARFVDRTGTERRDAAPVLYYLLVSVAGRTRRSKPAGPFAVPLAEAPPAPRGLAATYDEQHLTFTWQGVPGERYRAYDAVPGGALQDAAPPSGAPLAAAALTAPVTFGVARCLAVRGVREAATGVTIEGPASPIVCVTPVDTFPPPVPAGLLAFPGDGTVELSWSAVTASDLAGYVVLRAGDGNDTLLRLTPALTDLHYVDRAVTRGATYEYAVASVDANGNQSAPSARQRVTVRLP